ncbi:hypothetical protein BCR35DRAFT_349338 [Leucosporidium creatinivorum]|uniref:F-box domain-containing protein n=1 Tax=Leucosporidium creatinivorum TaxID=106004 RepID=A0A1Y2G3J1_9BASI|nr:hypothetical protein BCR35DRAFT_349338 [Leucosporidium creatinivorum]
MESSSENSATLTMSTAASLPPEVLSHIFGFVLKLDGSKHMKGAICKHLLPYTRANLFAFVKLTTWKQFRLLAGAVEEHEALGELVVTLVADVKEALDAQAAIWEGENPASVVEGFLGALLQVQAVVSSTILFTEMLLSDEVAQFSLPAMRSLFLEDSFLRRTLESLRHGAESITGHPRRSSFKLPNIFSLEIIGPLSNSAAATFIGGFDEALIVTLFNDSPSPKFKHILRKLHPAMKSLTLANKAEPDVSSLTPIDSALSRFTELDHLQIDACNIIGPDFYQALREPLRRLGFGYGVEVCEATLLDLVQGNSSRGRLASLEELELDVVNGERGTRIEEDKNGDMYFGPDEEMGPYPDWKLPNWTTKFTEEGARELVKAAEKVGVKITGSLKHALEVEVEWTNEINWVLAWEDTCKEIDAEMRADGYGYY